MITFINYTFHSIQRCFSCNNKLKIKCKTQNINPLFPANDFLTGQDPEVLKDDLQ